ncbi:uncharacterized protein LOC108103722 [Drosophila eugracilis]|uniref:uncharacterized protein LOC108103722 n=1 Tax=Drosophila eugracilis TaxID=29029 RepID=UPI0007E7298F|nr:uncharacterized protein LOC108103722 [Drosophila eugracilis]
MGCCASNLKLKELNLNSSIYLATGGSGRSQKRLYSSRNSSGVGSSSSSASTSKNSSRFIWSRSSQPICDDFAEQPQLDKSCGYYTCSSADSSPRKRGEDQDGEDEEEVLMRTQDMSTGSRDSTESTEMAGNLEWEMYMMQQAQRIMPKTSSPISQRRGNGYVPASSYQKWRTYLQSTPAHMLHNVTHIPEAIAGHFCPTSFPGFSDLEEMESAAKRFKVDIEDEPQEPLYTTYQLLAGHTHTISTEL